MRGLFFTLLLTSSYLLCAQVHWHGYATIGYHYDTFRSSMTGPASFSKLSWKNMSGPQIKIGGERLSSSSLWLGAEAEISWIWYGRLKDSFYATPGRQVERERTLSEVKGTFSTFQVAAGYCFCCYPSLLFIPMCGMAYRFLTLQMNRTIEMIPTVTFLSQEGQARYRVNWWTPFLGIEGRWALHPSWTLRALFRFYVGSYRGEGRAFEGRSLDRLSQQATALGTKGLFEAHYWLNCRWSLLLSASFEKWWTSVGKAHQVIEGERVSLTFNGAELGSLQISVGVFYRF